MSSKDKLPIPYPVVVEGKYDKIRLSNIIDAQIIVTDGFGVFRKEEKRLLLRRLAAASPLIVLTDSDGGGKIIRSHLSGMLPKDRTHQPTECFGSLSSIVYWSNITISASSTEPNTVLCSSS